MDQNQQPFDEKSKIAQLQQNTNCNAGQRMTTNQGIPLSQDENSLKAGPRGPTLLEDFQLREKITHFDHERIPERVVHARGFGAHGYFEVYASMAEYTRAAFLQDPGVKTPVFVRFSTVVGSRGSADTVRDVRGFAVKFYTSEGNYDLVGNNMPIFFIQDAIKFPDIVHAIKPEPQNEIPQATAAHDTFWDFVVNTPELAHMILWLMSDRGIPRSYRMMEGFGVNTFRFINAKGAARFVKFHWKPLLGVHSLVWDESQKLIGKDPDYHRRDLWEAIDAGDFPEFELGVQIIEEADEFKFDFDILDPTKFWPEEVVPVRRVGKMTLNRNVDNFFTETEQVAFHPGHVVPGIDFSNDPLLQGRLFSYLDTQLSRLGGPNFDEIPVNRPLAPVHNNRRDGMHRMKIHPGPVSYSKNTLADNYPRPDEAGGFVSHPEQLNGQKVRQRDPRFDDHFSQARLFWNSMSPVEKQHIVDAFSFEAGSTKDKCIKQRVVDLFNNVSSELASAIAPGLGADPPAQPCDSGVTASSPAVSMADSVKSAKTRKVAILAENGYDHASLTQVMDALHAAGVCAELVSSGQGCVSSSDGKTLDVGKSYLITGSVKYDAVFIPGGRQCADALMALSDTLHFLQEAFKHCKAVAAVNEGVDVLAACQLPGVSLAAVVPKAQVREELGVVTVRGAQSMQEFSDAFVQAIAAHRHWGRKEPASRVPAE